MSKDAVVEGDKFVEQSTGTHIIEVHMPTSGSGIITFLMVIGVLAGAVCQWYKYRSMQRAARGQGHPASRGAGPGSPALVDWRPAGAPVPGVLASAGVRVRPPLRPRCRSFPLHGGL
jgi:hypothetical protein